MSLFPLFVLYIVTMSIARVLRELRVAAHEVDAFATFAQLHHVLEAK